MSLNKFCFKITTCVCLSLAVSCSTQAQEASATHVPPPHRCTIERLSRSYLKQMCTYDEMSALATIALADELQFSEIWQQAEDIMRQARHLDREAFIKAGAINTRDSHPPRAHPIKSPPFHQKGCAQELKVLDDKWIEIVKANCPEGVNDALKFKLAHLYLPGPLNNVEGAKIRRRQVPEVGRTLPIKKGGGLSYDEEVDRLKEKVCLPYVPHMYQEICGQPFPMGYARLCGNSQSSQDVIEDFWAERRETMVENIIDEAQRLMSETQKNEEIEKVDASMSSLNPPRESFAHRSNIYRLDIEGIEAAPNGIVEIEVCPQKHELIDLIAERLDEGIVRKTQNGLIWEMNTRKN